MPSKTQKLLVIDTETGGTDPLLHSILSVAGVVWDAGATTAEFEILISEPVLAITPQALEINKIDIVRHCRTAVSPEDAVREINSFVRKHFSNDPNSRKVVLVGHNVNFDIGFLKRLYRMGGGPFDEVFSHRVLDTASVLRFLTLINPDLLPEVSSTDAFRRFGIHISESERHTALGDARATAALLDQLLEIGRATTGSKYAVE